ncbi:glycosyltransferase family 4 protein [Cohnella nanjingensis]|uniref:Glycosyltransferase family 4 protein n=1 Tax=Cohnella nanjingensis TaxID=1387779 RepID=A0A7X0VIR3_9BACL|nr:glycosyltransferase family 4 protein [Cohnella nanjingensis]MBB6674813.1 glycosyltransferase family 4 protein [Cohnella nanjingensis]
MNVLWAHDHMFYYNESGRYYSGGKLPYKVWQRYLNVFDQMTVVGRGRKLPAEADTTGKTLSSGPNVEFLVMPSLSNPVNKLTKKGYVERMLTDAILQADAVIARLPSELGAEAIRLARKFGKPFAVEVVACAWDGLWNYGNVQGKLYAPFSYQKTRALVRQAPFAIYVTDAFLQRRYPNKTGRIGVCSNVEIAEPPSEVLERRLARIRNKPADEPLVFGLIGSLNGRTKGIEVALRALARIRDKLPPFEFRILGDGAQDRWKALADRLSLGDAVKFCGVLPSGQAVWEWLDGIDHYLQPSFQEGLPRAAIEAMSRGCPVIGSTAGGIPELIPPDCLHKPGNDRQLAERILAFAGRTEELIAQAERNFARSADFVKTKLDDQRERFWQSFRSYAEQKVVSRTQREAMDRERREMA